MKISNKSKAAWLRSSSYKTFGSGVLICIILSAIWVGVSIALGKGPMEPKVGKLPLVFLAIAAIFVCFVIAAIIVRIVAHRYEMRRPINAMQRLASDYIGMDVRQMKKQAGRFRKVAREKGRKEWEFARKRRKDRQALAKQEQKAEWIAAKRAVRAGEPAFEEGKKGLSRRQAKQLAKSQSQTAAGREVATGEVTAIDRIKTFVDAHPFLTILVPVAVVTCFFYPSFFVMRYRAYRAAGFYPYYPWLF